MPRDCTRLTPGRRRPLHTGGAFDARGLSRPFHRIVYRIGEIGDPKIQVQNKTVAFKQAAGFGGRLVLTMTRPPLHEILWFRLALVSSFFPDGCDYCLLHRRKASAWFIRGFIRPGGCFILGKPA